MTEQLSGAVVNRIPALMTLSVETVNNLVQHRIILCDLRFLGEPARPVKYVERFES